MKKRIVKVERNGTGLVAVTFSDGTVSTMIGMSATEMLAAQALADMEGEPATATLASGPKRIVKTGLVYLDRLPHPVSASLVYDDATSEDVGFDLAAFKLASQALDDRRMLGWDAPQPKADAPPAPRREVRVNLNAEVRCVLTAEGAARVNAHMQTLPPAIRPRVCKAGDAWSCQLWDLARILGTEIGDPALTVDNVLTLRVGDLVEVSP